MTPRNLRMAVRGPVSSLLWYENHLAAVWSIMTTVTLPFAFREGEELTPGFLSAWEIAGDGLSATLTVRDGLTWHDGVPATADDVVETIRAIRRMNSMSSSGLVADVASEEAASVSQCVLHFTRRLAVDDLRAFLSGPVLPAHIVRELSPAALFDPAANSMLERPLGNGTYRVESFSPNHIVLARADGAGAWFTRIEIDAEPDGLRSIDRALAGELDVVNAPDVGGLAGRRADIDGAMSLLPFAAYTRIYVLWNAHAPLFTDDRVRRAIGSVIDRDGLLSPDDRPFRSPTRCFSRLGTSFCNGLPDGAPNRAAAHAALVASGFSEGEDGHLVRAGVPLEFELLAATASETLANGIRDQLAEVGVFVRVVLVGAEERWAREQAGEFEATIATTTVEEPDGDLIGYFGIGGRYNHTGVVDQGLEAALRALTRTDPSSYARAYSELERASPVTILHQYPHRLLASPHLTGVVPSEHTFRFDRWRWEP